MKKHVFAILHYFAVLLRLASTTRRKSSVANGLTTVEPSKTPIIDGHFHIIPGGDCSASISDYVLDQCLSSVGIDIHAKCSVTKFATLLKHRLSERMSTNGNCKRAMTKQCRDAVIRQMNVTDKGRAHLDRLSEFYNIDRTVNIDSDAMQRFVNKNMGLSFYIANNYEYINDLHISMSKIYNTTDRFTSLLSFANSKGVDFDALLIVFINFYKKFITIIELANKFQYIKYDDLTLKHRCEDIIAKFEETQQRLYQARISRDYSALDKDSITNLTYAYFLFQIILHKHNPHPFTIIMSSSKQKLFSADHFNLDFRVPLFRSKFAAPKRMYIFCERFRNRKDDILANYFQHHRQIIHFCTKNNETVDLTYYLAKNIVANYQS